MPLILAIEPDRRQAAQLTSVVRQRVGAELILVDTTERALAAIGNRVPDLVLVPALLSPRDDAALATALRVIAATTHVQMLTIPALASERPTPRGGMLSALRRPRSRARASEGCAPAVFAEQIRPYLERVARERPPAGEQTRAIEVEVEDPAPAPVPAGALSEEEALAPVQVSVAEIVEEPLAGIAELFAAAGEEAVSFVVEPPAAAVEDVVIAPVVEPAVVAPAEAAVIASDLCAVAGRERVDDEPEDEPAHELERFLVRFERVPLPVIEEVGDSRWPGCDEAACDPVDVDLTDAIEQAIMAFEAITQEQVRCRASDAAPDPGPDAGDDAIWISSSDDTPAPCDVPPSEGASGASLESKGMAAGGDRAQPEGERWMALALRASQSWPRLEGVPADAASIASIGVDEPHRAPEAAAAPVEPTASRAARDVAPSADQVKSEREWIELVESLRQDVERLHAARHQATAVSSAAGERLVAPPAVKAAPAAPERPKGRDRKRKPIQDEWGFFDPEQCGFAALLAKLDEVTQGDEASCAR